MNKNSDILEAWTSNKDAAPEDKNEDTEEYNENIFDPSLLEGLDIARLGQVKFNPPIENCLVPGVDLRLRPLQVGDFRLGFLQLLTQLTKVGDISEEQWHH